LAVDKGHITQCRANFLQQLNPALFVQTAENTSNWPGIVNLAFPAVEAETLMMALPDLAVSTGSACNAASIDPSYVLVALGLSREVALSSIRFSFGRYLTLEQATLAGQQLNQALERLKN